MTATKTCVINGGALGKRYVVDCPEHGRLSLPIDAESANDLVRGHNRRSHSTLLRVVGES